ncbi:hypothetical protein, partial [Erythrobacter sp.]|uniref:hypothetical protein n=1 Tax=Erythrobacter sp. TaxID=1042 RepID=UPI00311FEDFD
MTKRTISNRTRWIAGGVLVIAAIGLSVPVTLLTLPNVLPAKMRAKLADMPIASSPPARSSAAALAFQADQSPQTLDRVETLAREAILDDPLEVSAIRSLSFVKAYRGDGEGAMRLLRYGENLSRRDLMTELALAMEAKRIGNGEEMIRHYGHALATTGRSYDLVVSQLIDAAADPEVARELGQAMARGPEWRTRLMPLFIVRNEDKASLSAWAEGLWGKGVPTEDRASAGTVVNQLLKLGANAEAAQLIHALDAGGDRGARRTLVRNGDFEDKNVAALGWSYQSGASLSAMPMPAEDGKGRVLEMRAGSGHLGQVARQVMALGEGQYALSARLW